MPKYGKKGFIVELELNEVFVFGSNKLSDIQEDILISAIIKT